MSDNTRAAFASIAISWPDAHSTNQRAIDSYGRIVGRIERNHQWEWDASLIAGEGHDGKYLGRFLSDEYARSAVERAIGAAIRNLAHSEDGKA